MIRPPSSVRSLIWWAKVDLVEDRKRIMTSVFNLGDLEAVRWVIKNYTKKEIKECLEDPLPGVWDKKSLEMFTRFFKVRLSPSKRKKAIRSLTL